MCTFVIYFDCQSARGYRLEIKFWTGNAKTEQVLDPVRRNSEQCRTFPAGKMFWVHSLYLYSVSVVGRGPTQNILFCKINSQWGLSLQPISILIDVISCKFFQFMMTRTFLADKTNHKQPGHKFSQKLNPAADLLPDWRTSRVQLTSLQSPSPPCWSEPGLTRPPWTDTTAWRGAVVRTPPTPPGSRRRCSARLDRRTFLPNPGNRGSASDNPRNRRQ